jgi:hypothetical protein
MEGRNRFLPRQSPDFIPKSKDRINPQKAEYLFFGDDPGRFGLLCHPFLDLPESGFPKKLAQGFLTGLAPGCQGDPIFRAGIFSAANP